MKVIIAGGRKYHEQPGDRAILDRLHAEFHFTEVICGCATGADTLGAEWAEERGIPICHFRPDWKRFGRLAGIMRNSDMADAADALIAFPGGRGTHDMVKKAKSKGLKIFRFDRPAY